MLPPLVQPDVWYTYEDSGLFPELFQNLGGDGIGPMGGPAYEFSPKSRSRFKWPRYYDGVPLFYEWTRDYIKEFRLDRPNGTRLEDIRHVPAFVDNPMDMEFGPDGALYVLEYGDGFFSENPDAQLARIDFVRGNYTPVPQVAAEPTTGLAPLTVTFSSAGTSDPDGDPSPTRGTSTWTGRWTPPSRTRPSPMRRTASSTPRSRSPTAPAARRPRRC